MKLVFSLMVLTFVVFEASGYPYPVYTSSGNVDTWSYGDENRGGRVLSRSYGPYANRRIVRGGPTTYSVYQPESRLTSQQAIEYHQAVKRRQALLEVNDTPPQENAPFYPQAPDSPAVVPAEATELILPNDQVIPTTEKAIVPELIEPEIEEPKEEPVQQTKKVAEEKKQKKWFDEEDDDDEEDYPSQAKFLRGGSFFPMIFGWGSGSGPIAVANAYSTGKGGAAASHATAYATHKPIERKP
nr:uncharacterized protein LOC110377515 [Helicoverpa armigera]